MWKSKFVISLTCSLHLQAFFSAQVYISKAKTQLTNVKVID
ncbi:hypothetical protein VCHE48_3670 [Vibrio cholerae HE48]|nr:hypothetical protein VCHE48_3670 [Vibrio cholerae HE48]